MVELITVLFLAAVITALAAPQVDLTRFRSDAIARQVAGQFATAQRSALQRQHDVAVGVDETTGRLLMTEDENNSGTRDASERESWLALDRSAKFGSPPMALDDAGAAAAGGGGGGGGAMSSGGMSSSRSYTVSGLPSIIFRRNGAPSADFVVYVTSAIGKASAWRAVRVVKGTGTVEMWRFNGTAWVRGRV
jgi:hypothetical protein